MHLPFSFSKGYLIKEIENIFNEFIETLGESVGNAFPSCLYNSINSG